MSPARPEHHDGDLAAVFTRRTLRSLAGKRSFERGERYANGNTVTKVRVTASAAEATVRGSAPYRVRLWAEDGEPEFSCTCPVGAEGEFCKHAVALALVVTGSASHGAPPEPEPRVDVRAYLDGLGHDRLVDLALELTADDDLAATRLRLQAAAGH